MAERSRLGLLKLPDYEVEAKRLLDRMAWDFVHSGTDEMHTVEDNLSMFRAIHLFPNAIPERSDYNNKETYPDTSTSLLGRKVSLPVGVAPSAYHQLFTDDGEIATGKATLGKGLCYTQSLFSSRTHNEISAAIKKTGNGGSVPTPGALWLQLYMFKWWEISVHQVREAERLGYQAIVVTVDIPIITRRRANLRLPFRLPAHLCTPNMDNFMGSRLETFYDPRWDTSRFDWEQLRKLRNLTSLPIILKGIVNEEDVIEACKIGIDAVWISNHGGRALDGSLPAVLAVPQIKRKLIEEGYAHIQVYVDGGVRHGSDVLKCLALGADAVFIGRPVIWALSCGGQTSLEDMLQGLKYEIIEEMQKMRVNNVNEVSQLETHIEKSKL